MLGVKLGLFFGCAIALAAAMPNDDSQIVNGVEPLSGESLEEAKATLDSTLAKLAASEGPSYKVSNVNEATLQVVAGSIYEFDVDLIDGESNIKICYVSIWSKPWAKDGEEVTFDCEGEEMLQKYII